ncbi:MAG: heavy metal translocating P-type ATPase [Ardenticatenaceae bacterium]
MGFPIKTNLHVGAAASIPMPAVSYGSLYSNRDNSEVEAVSLDYGEESLERYERDIWLGGLALLGVGANLIFFPTFALTHPFVFAVGISSSIITSEKFFRGLWDTITGRGPLNTDTLLGTASVASLFWSNWLPSLAANWLMNVGEQWQTLTLRGTDRFFQRLLSVEEDKVWLVTKKAQIEQPLADTRRGDTVLFHSLQRIPLDGKIQAGQAIVYEGTVTGHKMPVMKQTGERVQAGSLLFLGQLQVQVEAIGDKTAYKQLVQQLQEKPTWLPAVKTEANRVGKRFISASLALSGLVFAATLNLPRTLSTLMIATPYAVGLAAPLAVKSAIASGVLQGIFIKTPLSDASQVDAAIFNKSGTLTVGTPHVTQVIPLHPDYNANQVLQLAATAERESEHPLGLAIINYAREQKLRLSSLSNHSILEGRGVWAAWPNNQVLVGNQRLMAESEVSLSPEAKARYEEYASLGHSVLYVAHQGQLIGLIEVQDEIRQEAQEALAALREAGISKLLLLTGDGEEAAKALAQAVGIDAWQANVLPEEKATWIRKLQAQGQRIALVSSDPDDAPALALADMGIAIGATDSPQAIRSADIALASNDLKDVVRGVKITQKTQHIIRQNYRVITAINAGGLVMAALGFIGPLTALLFPNVSTFAVVINSARLIVDQPRKKVPQKEEEPAVEIKSYLPTPNTQP